MRTRPFTDYPVSDVIALVKLEASRWPADRAKVMRSEWAQRIRKHRKPGTNGWNLTA